jgi:heme exporter protein B
MPNITLVKNAKRLLELVRMEFLLELRQQYSFYGIILYVVATIFVLYLSMGQPEASVWNGLFWTIQLFVCVNAVAKSFLAESKGRMLYFYSIVGGRDFILAKLGFNVLLMAFMSIVSWTLFKLLLGNPLVSQTRFLAIALLGAVSLSLVFTFLSAIAAQAAQNAALMAIMGFPILIPQLMLLMRISNLAFGQVSSGSLAPVVLLLLCLDFLVVVLAVILFPFLWKD